MIGRDPLDQNEYVYRVCSGSKRRWQNVVKKLSRATCLAELY